MERVSLAIASDPQKAFALTIKRNSVAVVSDGTAVVGLGDIGPYAAAPVMEGKCMLFKQFADIDAFPICLDTKDVDEIVGTVIRIAPIFGGIDLEDISAPRCFEIDRRLQERLQIPVMHDDQHGTAVVILAALLDAARVVGKALEDLTVVVAGSGAAGTETMKMLLLAGVRDVVPVDRAGALNRTDHYDNSHWTWLAEHTNPHNRRGALTEVLRGADVFMNSPPPAPSPPSSPTPNAVANTSSRASSIRGSSKRSREPSRPLQPRKESHDGASSLRRRGADGDRLRRRR